MAGAALGSSQEEVPQSRKSLIPKLLASGDRVAVVSPAGAIADESELKSILDHVRNMGFEPVLGKHASDKFGFVAGTDENRANDLEWAFTDPSIQGIICSRGGYGCTRMLPHFNMEVVRAHPKVIMGYSDITALLIALYQETGLVTFHGPGGSSSENEFSTFWMQKAISHPSPIGEWLSPENEPDFVLKTVTPGIAEAPLVGGNLSLLAAMCGTPHQISGKDHIIFIEDVREAPYRIDRMLTQLRNAKVFEGCKGVLVGQFTNCDAEAPNSPWKVADVISDRLGNLGVPVLSGAAIGHVRPKWTVPLGIKARLDATNLKVEVLEPAVKAKE